jgi:hypothetical protein
MDDGFLTIVGLPGPLVRWVAMTDLEVGAAKAISELAPDYNVYFGLATRREILPGSLRGGKEDCLALPAFALDVDIADPQGQTIRAHSTKGKLPADRQTALAFLQRAPVPPTAIVDTGHGLHAYWKLLEPLEATQADPWLARWNLTWQRYAREWGIHLDNTAGLERVFRLPGTINRKVPDDLIAARLIND